MSVQTTVELNIGNATEGLIADIHAGNQIVSAAVESATIPFGKVVGRGTDPAMQIVLGGAGANVLGVSVREMGRAATTVGQTTASYVAGEVANVMQSGYIFVMSSNETTAGDAVKYSTLTGDIGGGAAGADEAVLAGAQWMDTVAANGIGKIKVNL